MIRPTAIRAASRSIRSVTVRPLAATSSTLSVNAAGRYAVSTACPSAQRTPSTLRHFSSSFARRSEAAAVSSAAYDNILVSTPAPGVTLITLNRPKALNALNSPLFHDINAATAAADADPNVGAIVITGSDKAFAAGADIKEMKDKNFADAYKTNFLGHWNQLTTVRKPIIAAVSGFALGGGCELAMMCDVILAAPNAVFGQPEINLGVIPGAGGTQRLTAAIGKSAAMEIILTGRNMPADEAERRGLVARVVREGNVVDDAVKTAATIAKKGQIAAQAAKEAVNAAHELGLSEGVRFERRLFQMLFATHDQKEGMGAFAEKRKAVFKNE